MPAMTMMAAPTSVCASGKSPKKAQPKTIAHKSSVYCSGARTEAGASLSERVISRCAEQETTPSSRSAKSSWPVNGLQLPTLKKMPATRAPSVCQVTSVTSGVERSTRPSTSDRAKERLPTRAKTDGQESIASDGRSAMMTPINPIRTASQRRQPIRSPRKKCEIAAT
ncbi:hypothetical protein D3C87_1632300 [compost metagenome]